MMSSKGLKWIVSSLRRETVLNTVFLSSFPPYQVVVCGILLVVMAVGNFVNTVETLVLKLRFKAKMKRTKHRQEHGQAGPNRPHQN
jgi:uncharacterized membrane protein YecN with MAPEG domain